MKDLLFRIILQLSRATTNLVHYLDFVERFLYLSFGIIICILITRAGLVKKVYLLAKFTTCFIINVFLQLVSFVVLRS